MRILVRLLFNLYVESVGNKVEFMGENENCLRKWAVKFSVIFN